MDYRENEFLWVEKYRPLTLEDCILPADQKHIFQEMLSKGEIQNMLLKNKIQDKTYDTTLSITHPCFNMHKSNTITYLLCSRK